MANQVITPTTLVPGTESADLVGSGTAVNSGDTFEVDVKGRSMGVVFVLEEVAGGAPTITFDAGAYPPAALQGKGADTVVLAASDLRVYVPEAGRHIQSTGKITGSVATANCKIRCFLNASGY